MKTKIVYAGEKGAFAEIAARAYFGNDHTCEYAGVSGFEEVFNVVRRKRADFGIVPIENSRAGSIHQNYDLLLESKLYIAAETYLRVNHNLIAKAGTDMGNIREVYSHPQALAQCRKFLKKTLPRATLSETANTALAAKMVASDGRRDTAAIASAQAAAECKLEVIAANVEDCQDNVTRFLIVGRAPSKKTSAPRKTSLVFSIDNTPGGLFKSLGVFALRDIDLFKIESRPMHGKGFEYLFYLDCKGDESDKALSNAISHLKEIAVFYRMLGSYDIADNAG